MQHNSRLICDTVFVAVFASALAVSQPAFANAANAAALASCVDAPSRALADVGDALTTGSDANVLRAALANHRRLVACGLSQQAISTQLIAADAYGDVNQAKKRCDALRSARRESLRIGDAARAQMIEHTLRTC